MSVIVYTQGGKTRYRVSFEIAGIRYRKKGFATKTEAMRWEVEERRRIENPMVPEIPSVSFLSAASEYLEHCKARMQTNTWRAKAKYFRDFLDWSDGDMPLDMITQGTVSRYLLNVQSKHSSKRANRDLKDLKALFSWAVKQGEYRMERNPCIGIEPFPEEPTVKYVPPPEDIEKVILAADPEETDMLTVLYHTGGRIGEIRGLKWEDINFEKRTITLWTRKRRGGKLEPDPVVMGESVFRLLQRRWERRNRDSVYVFCREDGSAHTKDGKLRHLMEDLCTRAGVKPFGFHAIRHHVASILADSGKATLGQVQRFLRHRRASTTERYLHEVTRDQVEVAEILEVRGKCQSSMTKNQGSGE